MRKIICYSLTLLVIISLFTGCNFKSEEEILDLAKQASTDGNFVEAAKHYETLLKKFPQSEDKAKYKEYLVETKLSVLEKSDQPVDDIIAQINTNIAEFDDSTKAEKKLIIYRILMDKKMEEKAIVQLEDISVDHLKLMATNFVSRRKPEYAVKVYDYILTKFPEDKSAYQILFLKGFTYSEQLKDYDSAKEAFQQIVDKYPDSDLADDAEWMIRNMNTEEFTYLPSNNPEKK